jgi:hypothetical protein
MTAGNDETGLDPMMMAQQLKDSHRSSDIAHAAEKTMTAGNDETGLDPTMMAQQLQDSHRTFDIAHAAEKTMTAGNDETGLDPTMMAQQLQDSHRTSDLAHAAEKQSLGRRKVNAAKDGQSELTKASTTRQSARRSTRGSAHSRPISAVSNTATTPHLSKQPASNAKSQPHDKGSSRTQVSDDPAFAGVFEVERLLERQWSGKILWLKIKWKGIPHREKKMRALGALRA